MTTPEVAAALVRSGQTINHVKTVQRRLEALLEAGVVQKRKAGNTLEWQKKDGASGVAAKAGALMTFDEALALQTLRRFAGRQIPTLVGAALGGLFEVAEERLKRGATPDARRHASWHKKVAAVENGFQLITPNVRDDIFFAVSEALFAEQFLEVVYRSRSNPGKTPEPQILMPLGIVEMASLVYLVAKRERKPDAAMYRLDRMQHARVCPEPFSYPRDFSLDKYIAHERQFDFLPRGEISLAIRFVKGRGHAVREAPMSVDQTIEEHQDGGITVRGTVVMSERLRWWIRSFGPAVEVLEPADLREEFAAEAKAAAMLYAPGR